MPTVPTEPDPADLALVEHFAALAGVDSRTLVNLAVAALADHIRQHGSLQLPVRIGPPSPLCAHCPLTKALQSSREASSTNVISGPW